MMTAKKNFTFIKILGAGGNGMVVLFKWTPGGDPLAQGHDVVMKLTTVCDDEGTPQWELINEERKWMFVSDASFPRGAFLAMQVPD